MNPADNLKFKEVAEGLQTTRSQLLRKIILESIGKGPILLPQEMRTFEEAVFQLAALGRNLNQLLRAVNSGQVTASLQERTMMEALRDQVEVLKKEFLTTLDRSRPGARAA
jgi:hypothetical protein